MADMASRAAFTAKVAHRPSPDGRKRKPKMKRADDDVRESLQKLLNVVGIYLTTDVAGKGTYSSVYTATLANGDKVAVKCAHDLYDNPAYGDELHFASNGAYVGASLPILTFINEAGCSKIFVFPLVNKSNVKFETTNDNLDGVRAYIAPVLASLAKLHGVNVVHRDLKPKNVLPAGWTVTLTDFGLTEDAIAMIKKGSDGISSAVAKVARIYLSLTDVNSRIGSQMPASLPHALTSGTSRPVLSGSQYANAAKTTLHAAPVSQQSAPIPGQFASKRGEIMSIAARSAKPAVTSLSAAVHRPDKRNTVDQRGRRSVDGGRDKLEQDASGSSTGRDQGLDLVESQAASKKATTRTPQLLDQYVLSSVSTACAFAYQRATEQSDRALGCIDRLLQVPGGSPVDSTQIVQALRDGANEWTGVRWRHLKNRADAICRTGAEYSNKTRTRHRSEHEEEGEVDTSRSGRAMFSSGDDDALNNLDSSRGYAYSDGAGTGRSVTSRPLLSKSGVGAFGGETHDSSTGGSLGPFIAESSIDDMPRTKRRREMAGEDASDTSRKGCLGTLGGTVPTEYQLGPVPYTGYALAHWNSMVEQPNSKAAEALRTNLKPAPMHNAGTSGFKAPEQLFGYPWTTVATDLWAAGVMLLSALACRYPLFPGRSDADHMHCLFQLMGDGMVLGLTSGCGKALTDVPALRQMPVSTDTAVKGLMTLIPERRIREPGFNEALHLCMCLLTCNPASRVSADYLLATHPFLNPNASLSIPEAIQVRDAAPGRDPLQIAGPRISDFLRAKLSDYLPSPPADERGLGLREFTTAEKEVAIAAACTEHKAQLVERGVLLPDDERASHQECRADVQNFSLTPEDATFAMAYFLIAQEYGMTLSPGPQRMAYRTSYGRVDDEEVDPNVGDRLEYGVGAMTLSPTRSAPSPSGADSVVYEGMDEVWEEAGINRRGELEDDAGDEESAGEADRDESEKEALY